MDRNARIYVAGHTGLVGSAIVRRLRDEGAKHVLVTKRQDTNLADPADVDRFFKNEKPAYVILAAAKVGGIAANIAAPVEFLLENLAIQNNVLTACARFAVTKVMFLGSSCVYPRDAPQPMREESFLRGPFEPTNESYAVAKVAGIRLAQAIHTQYGVAAVCPMPSNVYGPNDHFEFDRSHVMSALVRRFVEAADERKPSVTLWGTGAARREFLHVDDLADACLFLMDRHETPELINVGSGTDYSILELAQKIAAVVDYTGRIEWDATKPDGMPRKLLDVSRIRTMGWHHQIDLEQGLRSVVNDFRRWQAGSGRRN
jgi:GDP-L-fucose synthase